MDNLIWQRFFFWLNLWLCYWESHLLLVLYFIDDMLQNECHSLHESSFSQIHFTAWNFIFLKLNSRYDFNCIVKLFQLGPMKISIFHFWVIHTKASRCCFECLPFRSLLPPIIEHLLFFSINTRHSLIGWGGDHDVTTSPCLSNLLQSENVF